MLYSASVLILASLAGLNYAG